jgi:hypothetical protein
MSEEKNDDNIYLYDGRVGFWARYFVSYGTLLGCIGIGVMVGSDALQWIGGVVWFIGLVGMAMAFSKNAHKTPQEAANHLFKNYGVKANVAG